MKILIPTVDYPPIEGGIGTAALQLSRELAALGHEVTVVAPHFPDMEDFDANEPYRVVRFRGYGLGWGRLLPFLKAGWPEAKRTDLILAINVAYGGVLGRLARLVRRGRYVAFAYAYEFLKFEEKRPAAFLLRGVYLNAETTVAISGFTASALERFGVPAACISTILPGAPEAQTVSAGALARVRHDLELGKDRYVLAVGRFVPRKNHLDLVRAFPQVLERCPNTHLVLVGRGPCLEECAAKAKALGIEGQVRLPGHVDDETLAALYTDCALFALPTGADANGQVEGFGLVFTEAHAYGKAVVAGRSGGVGDAVLHDKTGLVVPPGDVDRIAGAIVALLQDPARAAAMGAAGKRRVAEELNWRHFTERLLARLGVTE